MTWRREGTGTSVGKALPSSLRSELTSPQTWNVWLFLVSNKPARELGRQGRHPAGLCGYSVFAISTYSAFRTAHLFTGTNRAQTTLYGEGPLGGMQAGPTVAFVLSFPLALSPGDHAWASPRFPGAPRLPCCPLPVVGLLSAGPKFSHPLLLCAYPPSSPPSFSCGSGKGNTTGSCFSEVARAEDTAAFSSRGRPQPVSAAARGPWPSVMWIPAQVPGGLPTC